MRQLRRSMIARAVIGCWREPRQSWKRVAPIAVPFLIIVAVTDVGYFFKDVAHARHLVFFYLLPTAFVAMLYGSVLSMIFAIDATFIAGLFLYDPFREQCMALSMHLYFIATQASNVAPSLPFAIATVMIVLVLAVNATAIAFRSWLRSRKKW